MSLLPTNLTAHENKKCNIAQDSLSRERHHRTLENCAIIWCDSNQREKCMQIGCNISKNVTGEQKSTGNSGGMQDS